jgi:large subunit ribosomal protein L31
MKAAIHPKLNPVVFVDTGANTEFVTRSTLSSKQTKNIDGVDHFVIHVDISSASHPFYTGKQRAIQTAGRVERFNKKYNISQG